MLSHILSFRQNSFSHSLFLSKCFLTFSLFVNILSHILSFHQNAFSHSIFSSKCFITFFLSFNTLHHSLFLFQHPFSYYLFLNALLFYISLLTSFTYILSFFQNAFTQSLCICPFLKLSNTFSHILSFSLFPLILSKRFLTLSLPLNTPFNNLSLLLLEYNFV